MSDLANSKSLLAKLLAAENIDVRHSKVNTAHFNLQTRTLMLPIWEDMDGDLYDLLTGHEVGHALETPAEGWHDAVHDEDGNFDSKMKGFLNVLEDARIEKKIKRRYPGLSRSFASAYKGLYEKDFFGIRKLPSLGDLNLIDRINVHTKIGSHVIVSFNDQEREFVKRAMETETWEEVVLLAKEVFAYDKANKSPNKINDLNDLEEAINQAEDQIDDEDYDDQDLDYNAYWEEAEEGEGSSPGSGSETEGNKEEKAEKNDTKTEKKSSDKEEDPESVTDKIFREQEKNLVLGDGDVIIANLPEPNLSAIIVKNKDFVSRFEQKIGNAIESPEAGIDYNYVANYCLNAFNTNNRKFVSLLLKEFEMRKQAYGYARTTVTKTGELDMSALHKYKFTNDIFKKMSVVGKSKSHGMILFLDMSGSMMNIFKNTVEQLMVTIAFCKRANIPFEVYGFKERMRGDNANTFSYNEKDDYSIDQNGTFRLIELIRSDLDRTSYAKAWNMLAIVAQTFPTYQYGNDLKNPIPFQIDRFAFVGAGFNMRGTPYAETLLASIPIINAFKEKHKKDITNVVYMTDGDGSTRLNSHFASPYGGKKKVFYGVHKKTKKRFKIGNTLIHSNIFQSELTRLVKEITGCKHIGFYLCSKSYMQRVMKDRFASEREAKLARKENVFVCPSIGYDKYFYTVSSSANIEDEDLVIAEKMTKTQISSAFKKIQKGKHINRTLASKFAQEIS